MQVKVNSASKVKRYNNVKEIGPGPQFTSGVSQDK
jgi:hypothetical protein